MCDELRQELMVDEELQLKDSFVDWSPGPNPELRVSGCNASDIGCVSHQNLATCL